MAYNSSTYYESDDDVDVGEYYLTPYADHTYHDSALDLDQRSISYSGHEPSFQNLFEYDPTPYYHACHSTPTWPTAISYSASAYTNPISIKYDPKFYEQSYDTAVTRFVVSYSVSQFNEPEWDEYDPTPYGGGYDPAQFYGRPLPPSDETCYPRSAAGDLNAQNAPSFNGVSTDGSVSIIPFSGKEKIDEQATTKVPLNGSQPTQANEVDQQQQHQDSSELESLDQPSHLHDNGQKEIQGNGSREAYGYEYEKQVQYQVPSGYGLEAMDLCESLFGYWPCLSRDFKRGNGGCQEFSGEGRLDDNPYWRGTADYLFGSSYPYAERRNEGSNYGHWGPMKE